MANEIINEEGEVLALELDVNAAKELTESIKSTATATCLLLQQAHDKKAWKTLGYKTWAEYIENEFKFTRVRSYQLLAQASVIKEISEASDTEIFLTEKEAKLIKKELPKITAKVSDETKGLDTDGERKEKTTAILKEEIEAAMNKDRNTYDEGRELSNQDAENEEGAYKGGGRSYSEEDEDKWGPRPVKEERIETAGEANFYVENLQRTLSIMEAFPNAQDLAKIVKANNTEDEQIKFRNRVKYSISWLESLLASIK